MTNYIAASGPLSRQHLGTLDEEDEEVEVDHDNEEKRKWEKFIRKGGEFVMDVVMKGGFTH